MVVLAGVLILVTTACGPSSPEVSGTGEYRERVGQPNGIREYTDRADNKSRPDMSSYSDNDARNTAAARLRAKELSDRAERNVKKVQNPGELVEEIREGTALQDRVRNLTNDVGNATEQFTEDFAEGARENFRNLKGNTDRASQDAQRTARDLGKNAQRTAEDAAQLPQIITIEFVGGQFWQVWWWQLALNWC
jgi:hypothetical protein